MCKGEYLSERTEAVCGPWFWVFVSSLGIWATEEMGWAVKDDRHCTRFVWDVGCHDHLVGVWMMTILSGNVSTYEKSFKCGGYLSYAKGMRGKW